MQSVIIVLVVVLVLEIVSAKTASRTTTSTSTSTNRMRNKIGVPQPIFSPRKFLFRSDWTLAASGGAYMKLRQNGIVSLMIGPAVFLAGGWAYMKLNLFRQDYQDNFVLA